MQEDILNQLKVKRGSPIINLKATINKEGLNHVISFRRQVYVNPEDVAKIPELFKLKFENLEYFIFASTDVLICFICKIEGHLARNCTVAQTQDQQIQINTPLINNKETHTNSLSTANNIKPEIRNIPENNNIRSHIDNPTNVSTVSQDQMEIIFENKRTHSVISSEESHNDTLVDSPKEIHISTKQPIKRTKTEALDSHNSHLDEHPCTENTITVYPSTTTQSQNINNRSNNKSKPNTNKDDQLDIQLASIKNYLNNAGTLLNYIQFKSLLENTHKVKNPAGIISQYTNDLDAFRKFIKEDVYANVRDSYIKTRCTKLLKSIRNPIIDSTPTASPINSDSE